MAYGMQLMILLTYAFVLDATAFVYPQGIRRSRHQFSLALETKPSNDGVDGKDNDFKTWANALLNWRTTDDIEETNSDNDNTSLSIGPSRSKDIWSEEMSPVVASLSGMDLLASSNDTEEDVMTLLTQASNSSVKQTGNNATGSNIFPFLENALRWDNLIQIPLLQRNVQELNDILTDDVGLNVTFDDLVNLVPSESAISDTSNEVSEDTIQNSTQRLDLIINSVSSALQEASSVFEEAANAPRATAQYTAELLQYANGVLADGYQTLFENYKSFRSIPQLERREKIIKGAEFGALAGAVYEDAIAKATSFGHSVVTQSKTADIGWLITDSIQDMKDFNGETSSPTLVRTIVLRGYDASDEDVDREGLLTTICTATPVSLLREETTHVQVHEGMLYIAEMLMKEIEQYIDSTAPSHKIVFTGHSIGGSLSVLLLLLLAKNRGASFVEQNILRVFTYGSPPVLSADTNLNLELDTNGEKSSDYCAVLDAFGLPQDIVFSYSQPWDPIPRLFTNYDPLYPLIDDLGEDGYTPWVNGPPRTLRPIVKTVLENWEGWPSYRDNVRVKLGEGQDYRSVGKQFLLLPEPIRYLTDRFVSINTAVPEIDDVYSISSHELLPALAEVFTLETMQISLLPVAIRSFIHHFYPAYDAPFVSFANSLDSDEMEDSDVPRNIIELPQNEV